MTSVEVDSAVRRVARGGSLSALGMALSAIANFALVIVVTRGLGRSGAGSFFQIVAFVNIVTTSTAFGADTGFVRFLSRQRALGRTVDMRRTIEVGVVPPLALATAVAAVVFVTAPTLGREVLENPSEASITQLRVLAPFIVIGTAAWLLTSATRGFGTLVPYNLVENLGKPMLRLLTVGIAVTAGASATAAALVWALPIVLALPVAWVALVRLVRAAHEPPDRPELVAAASRAEIASSFWTFSSARGVGNVFQVGVQWLDVLLVGSILGPSAAGTYAVVSRLITTGLMLMEAIRLAVAPEMSALLARNDHVGTGHVYRLAASWCVTTSAPLYVLLFLFAPFVLDVFGGGFEGGQTALRILAVAMLVNVATGQAGSLMLMAGRTGWMLFNNLVSLVLDVVLNLVLLPRIGIAGAAWAWAASIVFFNVASVIQIRAFYGVHLLDRTYVRSTTVAVGFAVAGAVLALALGADGMGAAAAIGAALAGYGAVLVWQRHQLGIATLLGSFRRTAPPALGST